MDGCTHEQNKSETIEYKDEDTIYKFRLINQAPLNESNQDVLVNFAEYSGNYAKKTLYFNWVTNIPVTEENVSEIMRCGRTRS